MAFLYPWGNTQQLNLDWILQKIKELESGSGGADLDEVANALISATYARQAYDRSDIVFYDGKLYRANQAIPAPGEVWTPAHWDEILLGDTVSNLVQYVAALSNDQIVNNSDVSGTHTSDALNTLKVAIDTINGAIANKVLYYRNKTLTPASNAQILQIDDTDITGDHDVVSIFIANPAAVNGEITYRTYDGYMTLSGTCTASTQCNILLVKHDKLDI